MGHRRAGQLLDVDTGVAERDVREEFFAAMVPHLSDGVYVNFLGREGDDRIRAAFGDNYERLSEVKRRYDPENVFSVNQNVDAT